MHAMEIDFGFLLNMTDTRYHEIRLKSYELCAGLYMYTYTYLYEITKKISL